MLDGKGSPCGGIPGVKALRRQWARFMERAEQGQCGWVEGAKDRREQGREQGGAQVSGAFVFILNVMDSPCWV